MNTSFTRGMATATELTQAGKLQEATALILSLLGAGTAQPPAPAPGAPAPSAPGEGTVIDGEFTRLTPEPSAAPPAAGKVLRARAKPEATRQRAKPDTTHLRAKPDTTRLSETLRRIVAGGMPAHDAPTGQPVAVPEGAQFLSLTHTAPQGSRTYRLYIPANRPKTPMPLVVMLHGCTQTPEDFAAGTGMNAVAEEVGCMVAYPAQPSGANVQKCWNWFRPEDQGRDRGEPALIAGLTRDIQRNHDVDPARIYVAGLSAGGAAAVLVAAAYPDIFSAVGVHSGLPAGGAHDVASAFAAMRGGAGGTPHQTAVPTIVFHGLADGTVHPQNGVDVIAQATTAQPRLSRSARPGVSSGGRRYRATSHVNDAGRSMAEHWEIEGAGHAWAGGSAAGSYTDPAGPDASREMVRFFLQHARA